MSPAAATVLFRLQRTPALAMESAARCLAEAPGSLLPANPTQQALAVGYDSPEVPAAPGTAALSGVAASLAALCTHSLEVAREESVSKHSDSA